jgi:hypothetical protein
MTRLLLTAAFVLSAANASAQQVFNLADLGLGPITPFPVELDGDAKTGEWMTIYKGEYWVIGPGCTSKVKITVPVLPVPIHNTKIRYVASIQRVGGIDRLMVIDADGTDGVQPMAVYPIAQECYAVPQ